MSRGCPSHHIPGEGFFKPRREHGEVERYAVEVRGRNLSCKLNDRVVFTVEDDGPRRGTVGVSSGGGPGVVFDNLEVSPSR
jgi:hypothetical protein